jgi:MFS family permease
VNVADQARRYGTQLDLLNFLLADVRGGLGPYVSVFLLTQAHWDQATIGAVLTVSGLIGITLHAPVGALIDVTYRKRGLLVAGVAALSASALAIAWVPTVPMVLAADIAMAVLGAVFAPTVAAITLGLVGRDELAARLGRNAACDRAGNIFIAGLAGLVGWLHGQRAVFHLVPFFAVLTAGAVLSIPARAIDHARARGLDGPDADGREHPAGWRVLIDRRPLLVLAIGIALFHFANAPMLPLLGQKLALAHPGQETVLLSAAIMISQLVSIPVALLVGARADRWGRKPFLLVAFAALPVRGLLYAAGDHAALLLAVQALDGLSLGILDALVALVLADVMRGTGRYNASRGMIGTVQGVGGSLSNVAAGFLVVEAGYGAAFQTLATVGLAAFILMLAAMPETANARAADARRATARSRSRRGA